MALLLVQEAAAGNGDDARQTRALELVTAITRHPATRHVYTARAGRLADQLRRELPGTRVAAAVARGRQMDWPALGEAMLAK